MYNTSEEYLNAIKGDIRDFKLKGTMTTVSENTIELDEDDIVMDSYEQNSSSQPGDLFQHGGVVAKDISLQVLDRDYIIDNLTGDEWGRNLILNSDRESTFTDTLPTTTGGDFEIDAKVRFKLRKYAGFKWRDLL